MGAQIDDFCSLMELEGHGPDVYVGLSPDYPWGRVYGGQVVAQALRAAASTVEEDRRVHSLHAYFIRGGTSDEPIRYEVDRLRNGRSFTTRRVVARQSDGAILNLSCSFQKDEEQVDIQESSLPDDAGNPDDYESENWAPLLERRPTNGNGRFRYRFHKQRRIQRHRRSIIRRSSPSMDSTFSFSFRSATDWSHTTTTSTTSTFFSCSGHERTDRNLCYQQFTCQKLA